MPPQSSGPRTDKSRVEIAGLQSPKSNNLTFGVDLV